MYKSLLIAGETPSGEEFWSDMNRLRLELDLKPTDSLLLKAIYDNELTLGSVLDTAEFRAASEAREQTYYDLSETVTDRGGLFWRHTLYRLYLRYAKDETTLTVGRQRVAWGQARIWNPTDLFNPISPIQIEGGERLGVDAVNAEYSFGPLSGINLVFVPGREREERSVGARLMTNLRGYDLSIMAGEFREDDVIGFDFAGSIGDSGFRGEATLTDPEVGDDFTRLVLSWDYNFENSLYLLFEYLYNDGNLAEGTPSESTRRFTGEIATREKNFLATVLGYDLTPLVRLRLNTIYDLDGTSVFVNPGFTWNLFTDIDWSLGLQLFGGDGGEYGDFSNIFYTSVEWYF
ncbi:MAG: hypothetical protein V3W31_05435 [Thermodesulfobacteriota bacterium]